MNLAVVVRTEKDEMISRVAVNRIIFVTLIAGVVLIAGFTIPVIPQRLPDDVWTEAEFAEVKPKLKEAAEKLNQMTFRLTEAGYDPPVTYNLFAKNGHTDVRKSLFGNNRVGTTRTSTWSFGTWILPGVPHLNYLREKETVQITPENLAGFFEWIDVAEGYPGISEGVLSGSKE